MKQFTACVFGAGLLAATGAFAQSSENTYRFYIEGYGEIGYFDRSTTNSDFFVADLDMGFSPMVGTNDLGFGVSLGVDAFRVNSTLTAYYPAIEMGTSIGKFSVGVPRSVHDRGYFPKVKIGNSSIADLELLAHKSSAIKFLNLVADVDVWGLRYDTSFGNTKLGVSYHNLDGIGSGMEFYALAANHTFTGRDSLVDFMIYGGVEHVTPNVTDPTSYRVGIEAQTDKITAGLSHSDKGWPAGAKLTQAYVDYALTEDWTLSGGYGRLDSLGGVNIYGVGVQYDFLKNAYVKASYSDIDVPWIGKTVEVMLGWQF